MTGDVLWVRNAQGHIPTTAPMSRSQLRRLSIASIDPLINHYGLPMGQSLHLKRETLLAHLGVHV